MGDISLLVEVTLEAVFTGGKSMASIPDFSKDDILVLNFCLAR
jgi:hypothetical protein